MSGALSAVLPPDDRNAILESIGRDSRKAVQRGLPAVLLDADQLLFTEEEGVEGLYFPLSALICRLVSLPDGSTVKVSLAGREGMVGMSSLLDGSSSAFRTVVQLPGTALFLPRREARRLLDVPRVAEALFRYVRVLLRETSLTAACNRSHTATQRLSRWLLLIRDRAERDEFPITHESLAAMLGVRRERVSLSAQELRNNGALDYRRGTIAITNGAVLESESCSCYEAITNGYMRFLESALKRH
jgi:CRP-like cAMP-binding protein